MLNSYIIGKHRSGEGVSYFFGKVEAVKKGTVYGVIEKNAHIKSLRKGFEIPERDVVVDLGTKPTPGKVYGQEVGSRFSGRKTHDFFGPICFMYSPKTAVAQKLWSAFDEAAAIIKRAKLPPPSNSVWEVQSLEIKSKWAGYYKHSRNPEKDPHRFSIRPESVPQTVGDLVYVILHEYAHWVHANLATGNQLNAKWIRLFNTSIKLQTIKREQSASILKQMLSGVEKPSDFRGQLDEGDRNAFNWIIRTIKADHAVSIRELDLLFEAEFKDDLEALWPKTTLNKKDLKPVVSEYATTNFSELFAESFAFHFCKKKLPESVSKLVEKTLSYCRANSEKE
jgi:hypothetical protein